jgi:hypothetical protein
LTGRAGTGERSYGAPTLDIIVAALDVVVPPFDVVIAALNVVVAAFDVRVAPLDVVVAAFALSQCRKYPLLIASSPILTHEILRLYYVVAAVIS